MPNGEAIKKPVNSAELTGFLLGPKNAHKMDNVVSLAPGQITQNHQKITQGNTRL